MRPRTQRYRKLTKNEACSLGIEAKYRLTRGILAAFVEAQFPGVLGILTKSPMVTRDIDLLKRLPNADVGVTVTTSDDEVSRFLEVRAPLASRRIVTLRQLNEAGIPTYAFVGPLLPHFRYRPDLLDELFSRLTAAGVRQVYIEHMNLKTNNTRISRCRESSVLWRIMPAGGSTCRTPLI